MSSLPRYQPGLTRRQNSSAAATMNAVRLPGDGQRPQPTSRLTSGLSELYVGTCRHR